MLHFIIVHVYEKEYKETNKHISWSKSFVPLSMVLKYSDSHKPLIVLHLCPLTYNFSSLQGTFPYIKQSHCAAVIRSPLPHIKNLLNIQFL